jgi:hypothetical protein
LISVEFSHKLVSLKNTRAHKPLAGWLYITP